MGRSQNCEARPGVISAGISRAIGSFRLIIASLSMQSEIEKEKRELLEWFVKNPDVGKDRPELAKARFMKPGIQLAFLLGLC